MTTTRTFLLDLAKIYNQSLTINDQQYPNPSQAAVALRQYTGEIKIGLNIPEMTKTEKALRERLAKSDPLSLTLKNGRQIIVRTLEDGSYSITEFGKRMIESTKLGDLAFWIDKAVMETIRAEMEPEPEADTYRIKVRQYMTKPASPEFDFHDKLNKGIPMPMRIMSGRILQETKGMYKMECWGELRGEIQTICMKCGRTLKNPVSKYFGIGPECGGHNYVNPFDTDEELQKAIQETKEYLANVKWTGWIIKSALEEFIKLNP